MNPGQKPNRLWNEKSPYLLQHAFNPVDWHPWGEEAFDKAKNENKPIFLSIGYSTCHWCHVMERESFEDEEVAALLNESFVSIKVDREERPDIDHIYMAVCQALTGHGGWPLTVVLTPGRKPFFAGTYFPKRGKYGRRGLMELLALLAEQWKEKPGKMVEIGEQIVRETAERQLSALSGDLNPGLPGKAFEQYDGTFDERYGGFGEAPKFPTSHNLSFLLRYYVSTGNGRALEMVETTLDAMYRGGIYDHVGMGFSRYSTDEKWLVPHFEKMLYDNALLAITYTEAYQLTGHGKYAEIAGDILRYIARDMTDSEGGFYSAEDADSEGVEGKFYVWTPDETIAVLGDEEAELFNDLYQITPEGNFEGHSIPNLIGADIGKFAESKGLSLEEIGARMEASREKLFAYRERRVHPHKDDKILTSWNGLMIAAFAKAAAALRDDGYRETAVRAERFLWSKLRREDGRLLARFRDGEAAYPGYADDYAFYIWGLIELYEATFDIGYLQKALELNGEMIRLFWDKEKGGLFFYGSDAETLIARPKEIYDGAMPSGNSAAAYNLVRLSRLTGDPKLEELAEQQLKAFAGSASQYPMGHSLWLTALLFVTARTKEIVIVGDPHSPAAKNMIEAVQTRFLPHSVVIVKRDGDKETEALIPYVAGHRQRDGKPTAYVCENYACLEPVTDVEALERLLDS